MEKKLVQRIMIIWFYLESHGEEMAQGVFMSISSTAVECNVLTSRLSEFCEGLHIIDRGLAQRISSRPDSQVLSPRRLCYRAFLFLPTRRTNYVCNARTWTWYLRNGMATIEALTNLGAKNVVGLQHQEVLHCLGQFESRSWSGDLSIPT